MKTHLLIAATLLAAGPAPAQNQAARPVMRDAATHEQLTEVVRKAAEKKTEPVFQPKQGADPAKTNQPADLIGRSDILCYNGIATLVPKRAVLHIPKSLAGRIGMQDGAKIVTWPDFITGNRAWITTATVSRAQAEGKQPLSEATVKTFAKESRVVIAVYQECPISVLPLKVTETPPTAAQ